MPAVSGCETNSIPGGDHPPEAIAFLRAAGATPADIADSDLLNADAVVHLASATAGPVAEFCARLTDLLPRVVTPRILRGVVRPITCTSTAMYNFECADQDVPVFHEVCAALRDVVRNPEWQFAREGPTWRGQRVATWAELFE